MKERGLQSNGIYRGVVSRPQTCVLGTMDGENHIVSETMKIDSKKYFGHSIFSF